MNFQHKIWSIKELIKVYDSNNLVLTPAYQRNFIWSKKDQEKLIDSIIIHNYPLPSFFFYEQSKGKFEVVDGQQRSRTIINYYKNNYVGQNVKKVEKKTFENYLIPVTIISDIVDEENIEEFYARVNKTGLKLNKPELNKAEYYDTLFLKLNEELANNEAFVNLELFTDTSTRRMNDIDFTSELVSLIFKGISDKKLTVDSIYESDISKNEYKILKGKFISIIDKINVLNSVFPIKKTRYKQRNDFYTFFGFIDKYSDLSKEEICNYYKIAVLIGIDISPSNQFCEPLREYARNCITQSNSKSARLGRLYFFEQLFINENDEPNLYQRQLIEYYKLGRPETKKVGSHTTLNLDQLEDIKPSIVFRND